jgi:hypothetical protein
VAGVGMGYVEGLGNINQQLGARHAQLIDLCRHFAKKM